MYISIHFPEMPFLSTNKLGALVKVFSSLPLFISSHARPQNWKYPRSETTPSPCPNAKIPCEYLGKGIVPSLALK